MGKIKKLVVEYEDGPSKEVSLGSAGYFLLFFSEGSFPKISLDGWATKEFVSAALSDFFRSYPDHFASVLSRLGVRLFPVPRSEPNLRPC